MSIHTINPKGSGKKLVHDYWNKAACGENLYLRTTDRQGYIAQSAKRYQLEPIILQFAKFEDTSGKKVLEIGVGLGADHQKFAEAGSDLYGIDLTKRAVDHTCRRLELFGLSSTLKVGDSEQLDFPDQSFDLVYSWGVIHHSPDTPKAIAEIYRVLKSGGQAKVMIYHYWSMVGLMLWLRYALMTGRPWLSLRCIYANYLESPGTKAYSYLQARNLFNKFNNVKISTPLTHGDLLESPVGQRHRGIILTMANLLWPRWFIRRYLPRAGLYMLIEASK
jgi:SAM-dependent methyltransferase